MHFINVSVIFLTRISLKGVYNIPGGMSESSTRYVISDDRVALSCPARENIFKNCIRAGLEGIERTQQMADSAFHAINFFL